MRWGRPGLLHYYVLCISWRVPTETRRLDLMGLGAFAAIVVLLGVNFVAVRFSNAELPPFWGAAFRFAVAAAILGAVVQARSIDWPRGRALVGALAYGATAFGATYAFVYWGLLGVSSGTTSLVFATTPLLTLLMASAIGIERLGWRPLGGALVAIAGMAIVVGGQVGALSMPHLIAVLLAAAAGAASGFIVKRAPAVHPVAMNAIGMTTGVVVLVAVSLAAGETWRIPVLAPTWVALTWLVMSAAIAFILFVWLIRRWSASAASYTTVLFPIVTILVAAILVDEPVTAWLVAGALLVAVGVYFGALSRFARAPPKGPSPPPEAQRRS